MPLEVKIGGKTFYFAKHWSGKYVIKYHEALEHVDAFPLFTPKNTPMYEITLEEHADCSKWEASILHGSLVEPMLAETNAIAETPERAIVAAYTKLALKEL